MQIKGILQTVVLMLIVALAASCAATKEYSSKLFSPRDDTMKDSQAAALRFLELDSLQSEKEGWVTTDIIMGRDTGSNTLALDKLAKTFPAVNAVIDTNGIIKEDLSAGQTGKTTQIVAETKPVTASGQPIAKNFDPGGVRVKKTRDK